MFRSEREDELLSLLSEKGYATVSFLSETLGISQSSIRRDLALLESKGLVSRSYGGVSISGGAGRRFPSRNVNRENRNEKKRIASAAAAIVKEGDTVFVDGSDIAALLLPELVRIKGITVVTNSIDGLIYLSGFAVKTVSTGGMISAENGSVLVGSVAETTVGSIYADIMFFSPDAVTDDGNVCGNDPFDVGVKNAMMKNSRKTVMLCDGGKLGKTAVYRQCSVADVNCIISDSKEIGKFAEINAAAELTAV